MTIADLVQWFAQRGVALLCDSARRYESEPAPADRKNLWSGNLYSLETEIASIKNTAHQNLLECLWCVNRSDGKIDVEGIKNTIDEHRQRVADLAMNALAMLKSLDDADPERVPGAPPESQSGDDA